jgi:hypothetical protein
METIEASNTELLNENKIFAEETYKLNLEDKDNDTLFSLYKNVLKRETLIREILENEFLNLNPTEKIEDMNLFIEKFQKNLARYHGYLSGDVFEDSEWYINDNDNSSEYFKLEDNTVLLFNTINRSDQWNKKMLLFIKNIKKIMNKMSETIRVSSSLIDDTNRNTCWVIFKVQKNVVILD